MTRACGNCGVERVAMIGMQPGRDRMPWFLCWSCWYVPPIQDVTFTRRGRAR